MIIRKLLLLQIVLLICIFPGRSVRSEDAPAAASEIIYIGVSENNGATEIEIKSSGTFTYKISRPSDPYKIMVDLQETGLGKFTEKITVDRAGVLEIVPVRDETMPNVARLEISLTVPVDVEPVYNENDLILAFDNPDALAAEPAVPLEPAADEQMQAEEANEEYSEDAEGLTDLEDTEDLEDVEDAEYLPESPAAREEKPMVAGKYAGEKISIDFQDAELIHVFRLLADVSGYNIVVSPDVKGKFSMKLIDVPWDQALDVILRNYQLSKAIDGNIIRIAPTALLVREEEEIARAKDSQEKSGDLVTRIYPINYADVTNVKKAIDDAKILTNRGFISIDTRTTSVIIKDVESKHEEYGRLIKALDLPTPQVSIDARIVEVTKGFTKELGIQWGALVKPTPQTQISGSGLGVDSGFFAKSPLLVNLPATVGRGTGGSIGIGYIGAGKLQ
ncbi:MAG: secretin and TonB N-terminal domain-containing protein, partial [Nitrospirota bacterium]|nr:secretin and TonB N-terminal domain-containing protein [Nitrospirota bacterium]